MIALLSLDHCYPKPIGYSPNQGLVLFYSFAFSLLGPSPLLHHMQCFCFLTPCPSHSSGLASTNLAALSDPPSFTFPSLYLSRYQSPLSLQTFTVLALYFLHHSFHLIGILYHQYQSPIVTEREPSPRPLSLVHPTMLGTQRGTHSPVCKTVLKRTKSLPAPGLCFPTVGARPVGGYQEDDCELREYFC